MREVTPDEFRARAALAGWQMKTVELFLQGPMPREYVGVGKERLRVKS